LKISKIIKKILEEEEKISNLEWIWEKIFSSIKKFFTDKKNLKILEWLEKYWVQPKIEEFSKKYNGKRILNFKEVSPALIRLLNGRI
jgi:hypothetical protein